MVAFHDNNQPCRAVQFVTFGANAIESEQLHQKIQQSRPAGTLTEMVNQEESFENLFKGQAQANPKSHYYSTDTAFLKNDADMAAILEHAFKLPPGKSYACWNLLYPRSRRELSDMVMGTQSDNQVFIYAISETKDEAENNKKWLQKTMEEIRPHSVGAYLGESDSGVPLIKWSWGEHNTQRLMQACQKWDPKGVFAASYPRPKTDTS